LVCFWLGCSTESTGLVAFDDANAPQNLDESDAEPDATVSRPDRGLEAPPPEKDAAVPDAPVDQTSDTAGPEVAPDKPAPTNQPPGAACGAKGECASGHCADGVCCDVACDDGCSACTLKRTGRTDGTCSWSKDLEGKVCGKGCSAVAAMPAVVEKVCVAGACVVPVAAPKVIESCRDDNPCVVAFCDDNDARCVRTTCPQQGTCCCRAASGQRTCTKQDQCKGERMCVP
jgi:hypothetical protein